MNYNQLNKPMNLVRISVAHCIMACYPRPQTVAVHIPMLIGPLVTIFLTNYSPACSVEDME